MQKALAIVREISAKPEIARCLAGLGRIALSQGDLALGQAAPGRQPGAEQVDRQQDRRDQGPRGASPRWLPSWATWRRRCGWPLRRRRCASRPGCRGAGHGAGRVLYAAADLGEEAVSALWAAGSALSGDEASEVALAVRTGPAVAAVAAVTAAALTAREREIADLIEAGSSNKEIAERLFVSPATAARHVANIMAKLGFNTRAQIAAWVRATYGDRTGR